MFSPFLSKEALNFSYLCFLKVFFWNTIFLKEAWNFSDLCFFKVFLGAPYSWKRHGTFQICVFLKFFLEHHLSMKDGSLFCFGVTRSTKPWCFRSSSWCLSKALHEEGCMGLIPWHLDLQCKSSWILNDFFTKN
jgi:hypothetical protein